MKKLLFAGIAIVAGGLVLMVFSSCSKPNEKKEGKAAVEEIIKKTGKGSKATLSSTLEVVKKIDKINSGIKVPDNLLDCPDKYFDTSGTVDCPKQEFCSYYKTVKDGKATYHNLEFTNECSLCKYHKKKGTEFHQTPTTVYIHLGYQRGKCYQGIYKGQ